jgi:hypothetical protein
MAEILVNGSESLLTSNSQFLFIGNTLFLVSNTDSTGTAYIMLSLDFGATFSTLQAITGLSPAFDPAVATDGVSLYFIGTTFNHLNGKANVSLYSYAPGGPAPVGYGDGTYGDGAYGGASILASAVPLITNAQVGSDYDIICLPNGSVLAVLSVLNADGFPGESIIAFMISSGVVSSTTVLLSSAFKSGMTYGTVALASPDAGNTIELYVGAHPKLLTFKDFPVTISTATYTSGWSGFTNIYTGSGRYVSTKLTVVANGEERFLAHSVFNQTRAGLSGDLLLGYKVADNASWDFKQLAGTPTASYTEPTLSISLGNDGLGYGDGGFGDGGYGDDGTSVGSSSECILAYVVRDFTQPTEQSGLLHVDNLNVITWNLSPYSAYHYAVNTTYLRGTAGILPANMNFGFLAETQPGGDTVFYTGFDTAPTAVISPSAITATRGTLYTLTAANTINPTLDTLTYAWACSDGRVILHANGVTCTITVPLSVGASAFTFTVTVTVTAVDNNGLPLHNPSSAVSTVTVPIVAPPVISVPTEITVPRNSTVVFEPIVTYTGGYPLIFQWTQLVGTVLVSPSTSVEDLNFSTTGANINGETIVWQLSVTDNINAPVTQNFIVDVESYVFNTEGSFINRSFWTGDILSRNTSSVWSVPSTSKVSSNLKLQKKFTMADATDRSLFLSDYSVLVYTVYSIGTNTFMVQRRLVPPSSTDIMVDAVQSENDYTLVLVASNSLLIYEPVSYTLTLDNPQISIALSRYTNFTSFNKLYCTYIHAARRVVVLSGPQGCLILQMDNSFNITGSLQLSVEGGLLYGADNVQWVRTSGVESLTSGQLFLGTLSSDGLSTYESLIDLTKRSVVATWDAIQVANTIAVSGEFVFTTPDPYTGTPEPPVITSLTQISQGIEIIWIQQRTDLCTGFQIYVSTDNQTFILQSTITSGAVNEGVVTGLTTGTTYWFQIVTLSLDGNSAPSESASKTFM